jgi:hypothetical protein
MLTLPAELFTGVSTKKGQRMANKRKADEEEAPEEKKIPKKVNSTVGRERTRRERFGCIFDYIGLPILPLERFDSIKYETATSSPPNSDRSCRGFL